MIRVKTLQLLLYSYNYWYDWMCDYLNRLEKFHGTCKFLKFHPSGDQVLPIIAPFRLNSKNGIKFCRWNHLAIRLSNTKLTLNKEKRTEFLLKLQIFHHRPKTLPKMGLWLTQAKEWAFQILRGFILLCCVKVAKEHVILVIEVYWDSHLGACDS